jgi:hypothetical protein
LTDGPPPWTKDAACTPHIRAGNDPWHPDIELPARVQAVMYEAARVVCVGCPVQVQCMRFGLELLNRDSVDGMYGGATPDQLRQIARAVSRSPRKMARRGSRSCYVRNCGHPECCAANTRYEAGRRKGQSPR